MNSPTVIGFRRLAVFTAATVAAIYTVVMILLALSYPYTQPLRFSIFMIITVPIVAGAAWAAVRGIAWVIAGFQRRAKFPAPRWN